MIPIVLHDAGNKNLDEIQPSKKKIGLIRDCFGEGINPEVAEIVRAYGDKLKAQGYDFVTVPELFKRKDIQPATGIQKLTLPMTFS